MIANIFGNFLLFFVFMIGFMLGVASTTGVTKTVLTALAKAFETPLKDKSK